MVATAAPRLTRAVRAARLYGLYAIVNEGPPDPIDIARAALRAGVRILQYRAKRGIVAAHVRALQTLTHGCGALLILNDDPEAAVHFDCDGVHLGPDDGAFADLHPIRALVGDRLIGVSCGTVAEVRAIEPYDVDYIGAGSVYATSSKADAGDPIGVDGLKQIARASHRPVAAIGGIGVRNISAVARTGVAMAAVISALTNRPDPERAARALVARWNQRTAS